MTDSLDKWDNQVNRAQTAHYAEASRLQGWHFTIGITIMVLSTALLAVTFTDLRRPWSVVLAVTNLSVAVLAGLQTFVRFAQRAEQHRSAAVRFGALRRELEHYRQQQASGAAGEQALTAFRQKWDQLSEQSPQVSSRLWKRVDEGFFNGA